jgi:hypothetical protein
MKARQWEDATFNTNKAPEAVDQFRSDDHLPRGFTEAT